MRYIVCGCKLGIDAGCVMVHKVCIETQKRNRIMTITALNEFIANTESAMSPTELSEWMSLTKLERQSAAYAAFVILAKD